MDNKTTQIILNPYAGRWKAQAAQETIEQTCRALGLAYEMVQTTGRGHGIDLARQAVQSGYASIVAAGGDGTINEVVNGIMQAGGAAATALGVIPLGSADDFATMLGLALDIEEACRSIQAGHTRLVDLGMVNQRYFVNNSAIGLEPLATIAQQRIQWIKGQMSYIPAALQAIITYRPWEMHLEWDEGDYQGDVTLVSVGNTRRTGGAFLMTPRAEPDDGLLDFIFAATLSKLRLLNLLPKTFKGTHVDCPEIIYCRTTRLEISCEPPTPLQADGEVLDPAATHITYQVHPNALRLIAPAGCER